VSTLVFDSTVLSHFARAARLAELEAVTAADECIVSTNVLDELTRGVAAYPELGTVSAQGWLHPAAIDQFDEAAAFARYKGELGGGPERNNGEAVLDRATAEGIVDDLINNGMWLPVANGAALFAWAYGEGLLP
jgi:hypothetical protein